MMQNNELNYKITFPLIINPNFVGDNWEVFFNELVYIITLVYIARKQGCG